MSEPWSENFVVVYGSKKHEIIISGEGDNDITLQDLSNAIAEKCDVSVSKPTSAPVLTELRLVFPNTK